MDVGVGLDGTLGLSFFEEAFLSVEAAKMGYSSIWTPEGPGLDSFLVCSQRWAASASVVSGGVTTGISVSPVGLRTPFSLAMSAGTVSKLTDGRFILGIGSGGIHRHSWRNSWGFNGISALQTMRDYLITIRGLLAGEKMDYRGTTFALDGARLGIKPPQCTPVYLAALGPKMLRVGGELADGVALNWCTSEQVSWSRDRISEGAESSGRDPSEIKIAEYIRVCVDDNVDDARMALAKATIEYVLGKDEGNEKERFMGYRGHFDRMGFEDVLSELDNMRNQGVSSDDMADAFPADLLSRVGYFGPASGAASAFKRLSRGLDVPIVRVVASRPGLDAVMETMRSCRPLK
tara:strand:- start:34 stop:1077 length:1044 start_codon:yes stop_codon:yes gene_type:complete